jgi:hypothetical protein
MNERSVAEDKVIAEKLLAQQTSKPVVKSFRKGVVLPSAPRNKVNDYSIKGKRYVPHNSI